MNKKSILHIIDSGGIYGIEKVLINLLPELVKSNYDVALANLKIPADKKSDISDFFTGTGVCCFYPSKMDGMGFRIFPFLLDIIKKQKPAIIHVHGYKATIIGGLLALVLKIPCIATYHAESKHATSLSKYVKIETQFLRRFSGVVAVSHPIMDELIKRKVKKPYIEVINNGISDNYSVKRTRKEFAGLENKTPLLLYAGRLIEKKNIDKLIDVVARLKDDFPQIGLVIAGDGPYKMELLKQAERLNILNSLTFLGYVKDINLIYYSCDIFVLPSQTEGLPISLLEAMAFSLPIVISSVGSIPSVITHGVDALTINPNDENSIYEALYLLLKNEILQRKIGREARKTFLEKYSSATMAGHYISFYNKIIK